MIPSLTPLKLVQAIAGAAADDDDNDEARCWDVFTPDGRSAGWLAGCLRNSEALQSLARNSRRRRRRPMQEVKVRIPGRPVYLAPSSLQRQIATRSAVRKERSRRGAARRSETWGRTDGQTAHSLPLHFSPQLRTHAGGRSKAAASTVSDRQTDRQTGRQAGETEKASSSARSSPAAAADDSARSEHCSPSAVHIMKTGSHLPISSGTSKNLDNFFKQ